MENTVEQLMKAFEEKLQKSYDHTINSSLKELLDSLKSLPEKMQEEYGMKIADMAYEQGRKAYDGFDAYRLPALLNCVGTVFYRFPDNESIALMFLELDKGQLELKLHIRENDNLEIYQEDIEDVVKNYPTNEKIGLESMMCYANLQANCSMAAQTMGTFGPSSAFVEKNIDGMEAISARFPNNKRINLIYCRSLAATVSELYNHPNREKYNKAFRLLKNLVETRNFNVPTDIPEFLQMLESR